MYPPYLDLLQSSGQSCNLHGWQLAKPQLPQFPLTPELLELFEAQPIRDPGIFGTHP